MESLAQNTYIDHEQLERLKAQDDIVTQFSELVDGSMRTDFELSYAGGELYGRDGRAMGLVIEKALESAEELARKNPQLDFEVRRRTLESEEYNIMLAMARGEAPNTMIILSDFPEELVDSQVDLGGYNVTRKQTMKRLLLRLPNGNIKMFSQSLDGSDRQALESIYEAFDQEVEPGELLGQRIQVDLPAEEQDYLADRLTGIYDRSLSKQYGGEWYAGRRPVDYRNTFDFVRKQSDIIDACVQLQLENKLDSSLLYDMAATMQSRFTNEKFGVASLMQRMVSVSPEMLYHEVQLAGNHARESGMTFSSCGSTLRPEGAEMGTDNDLEQAGYGNKSDSDDCEFISKKCPMCGARNVKTKVTKSHISGSCGCSKSK